MSIQHAQSHQASLHVNHTASVVLLLYVLFSQQDVLVGCNVNAHVQPLCPPLPRAVARNER
jgi:hypothetical protein